MRTCTKANTLLPPATKLGQGNIFTPVCHSVHRGGHAWLLGGGRAWLLPGGVCMVALGGGMHGCSWGGGGVHGCSGGHA